MVDRDKPKKDASDPAAPAAPVDAVAKRDRASILARRKFFIASALAGITAASCNNKEPQVCLKVASEYEPETGAPEPCLAVQPEEDKDSAVVAAPSAPAPTQTTDPEPAPTQEPQVCLKVAPPPPDPSPKVCLRFAAPPKDDSKG
jgi:hypothetical protein